ncbi:acyl-CoA thioesterase [Chitinophaga silvisoli]|uniref:Acyl-CoA thioesterase n=1 Tax=Chitinophaga silvisoli TaxID=2291814 RepID=A0A3E1P918_9BACT|nr:thioesterase family protein [Chitinophaga silvisoli]RFM36644.1 acyl-CoA thioesterase [Chitinophaga silvisoli]
MFIETTHIRVRYGETDQMGYLYYGNYALYYEVGRAEAIRNLGFTYAQLEKEGVIMPVAELNVKYIRPAYYDDLITVKTILKEMPVDHKIRFHSELYNEKGELLNVGVTTLVFLHADTKLKYGLPPQMREALAPFFE